jgi:NPCBM/NEW2 domain
MHANFQWCQVMHLDSLKLVTAHVGYGNLGLNGSLGYENKAVVVMNQPYRHSVSAHAPARVTFALDGRFATFRCHVALNDDVPASRSHASFFVVADGTQVACAPHVVAGSAPRALTANIAGAQTLELRVHTTRWEYCHAVWLDPEVDDLPAVDQAIPYIDCLGRAEVAYPVVPGDCHDRPGGILEGR